MANNRKSFFEERDVNEIRGLSVRRVNTSRCLIDKIMDLDPSHDALQLDFRLLPGRFFRRDAKGSVAARKAYKHGDYLPLSHSRTLTEAIRDKRLPHQIREEDFLTLMGMNESDVNIMGYSFRPVQGSDRVKRVVPFAWILEGARLFAYAINETAQKIEVKPYDDAERVQTEGAVVSVSVPSMTAGKQRYMIRVEGVPVVNNANRHAIWTTTKTSYAEGKEPEHRFWSFGYKYGSDREGSKSIIFYPHCFAAIMGVARHYMMNEDNTTPWDMNPLAKPSVKTANFYRVISNNILVFDPTLKAKIKLRKLYVPEKSIAIARFVVKFGPMDTMFWRAGVDPKLHEYDWSIPGK